MSASSQRDETARQGASQGAPTLSEVRAWPATVDIAAAARALGVSRSHAYALVERGEFPATVLSVGYRLRVVTASLIAVLER